MSTFLMNKNVMCNRKRGARMRAVYIGLLSFLLASCETMHSAASALPPSFSTENIMKVKQGMRPEEILELFGDPNSIKTAVCGQAQSRWNCTTWEYGNLPYDRARFTFSGDHGEFLLNDFSIERERAW